MTRVLDSGGRRGPPLVLVHALAHSLEIWERVFSRLAHGFRVIAFDLPGFGQASRPHARYDGAFFATQLKALLDVLGLGRCILVGNSLGASVVLRFSTLDPGRIERAVLAAPGGFGRETHLLTRVPALPLVGSWLGRPTPRNNALTLRLAIHSPADVTDGIVATVNRYAALPGSDRSFVRTLQQGVGLCGSRDRDVVARIAAAFPAPSLVVWGMQDRIFPPAQAQAAAAVLPRSELLLLDACGHYPHWEQPEAFARAVERFCR